MDEVTTESLDQRALRIAEETCIAFDGDASSNEWIIAFASRLLAEQAQQDPVAQVVGRVHKDVDHCVAYLNSIGLKMSDGDPLYSVPQQDSLDAKKYRQLRDGENWPAVYDAPDSPEPLRGENLDAAMREEGKS